MIHLHMRSCYSLLESPSRLEDIVEQYVQSGRDCAVLTDHHTMYGTMKFIDLCREKGVKPIIGLEFEARDGEQTYSFLSLAKNDSGLQELYALSSRIQSNNDPVVISEITETLSNCAVISMPADDSMREMLKENDIEQLTRILDRFNGYWDDYHVSVIDNDQNEHKSGNQVLKKTAQQLKIPSVAVSRTFYIDKEDVEHAETLKAIETGSVRRSVGSGMSHVESERYFRNDAEMEALYDAEDLAESDKIASSCHIELAMRKSQLPAYDNPQGISSQDYLKDLCRRGLNKRMQGNVPDEYKKRLEYELSVITEMGFSDYFLVVYDFIRWSRINGIMVGPGRGSAAGSLVAWCMGITHIDPIKNGLLFERFLNPERISMPDIDVDFPDNRRDDVVKYVEEKYGDTHVSRIIALNTLKAKQVLRDVGRTMGVSLAKIDMLAKLVPAEPNITLKAAYENVPDFRHAVERDDQLKAVYEASLPLEGLPRHTTIHAAGVVISDQDIENVCPLTRGPNGAVMTQFTAEYLERLGLIKMDFLGLRNLTLINEVVNSIKEAGLRVPNVLGLPLNDPKTYALLSSGDTSGVFQLESYGMRSLLRRLKPSCFEDISAVLALYRPGPMQNIDHYIKMKRNPQWIRYPHLKLEPILKETYGVMVYQEEVMQIAVDVAGFSMAKADFLRKAMSKKDAAKIEEFRHDFIEGAEKNGISEMDAEKIYANIERFAEYGFNKSHSYVYALISYQTAYLKANYPRQFYKGLLNSVIGNDAKTTEYLKECEQKQISILHSDVNYSEDIYRAEKDGIRPPLKAAKGIGTSACTAILNERAQYGEFKDYADFMIRCRHSGVNRAAVKALIKCGALDSFGYQQSDMLKNVDMAFDYAQNCAERGEDGKVRIKEGSSPFLFIGAPPAKKSTEKDVLRRNEQKNRSSDIDI